MVSTIKKRNPTHKGGKLRLLFVGFLFFIIWAILLVRSAYVQLYKGDEYSKLASKQIILCFRVNLNVADAGGFWIEKAICWPQVLLVSSVYVHPFQIKDNDLPFPMNTKHFAG